MNGQPPLITDRQQLARELECLREKPGRLGLVPTMGAFHDGHISLVRRSVQECQATAVTIFVNPAQFNNQLDLEEYPRDMDRDLRLLSEVGVDLVYAPSQDEIYPDDFSEWVEPPGEAEKWEGEHRPGHFRGVCTVVKRLFQILPADVAFFGEKDYQQSVVIRQLVRQLGISIHIEVCPTVREHDGLAMSSRNAYLSPAERQQAPGLWKCLQRAQAMVLEGETRSPVITGQLTRFLEIEGFTQVDYLAIVDPETLESRELIDASLRLLVAARLGTTRLIDNCLLSLPAGPAAAQQE
jgi:pantoate--beta-alanine ligase